MNTPSEATVVPAVDGKEEPEPKLAAVARKPAQKKSRKAVKNAARKVTKRAASRLTKRREFPYQLVLKMWNTADPIVTVPSGGLTKSVIAPTNGATMFFQILVQGTESGMVNIATSR
jgi:hypothetical protein